MDVIREFENVSAGLVAAIRTMTGARRRAAEARLSRSIEALVAEHAADGITFVHSSEVSEPAAVYSEFKMTRRKRQEADSESVI